MAAYISKLSHDKLTAQRGLPWMIVQQNLTPGCLNVSRLFDGRPNGPNERFGLCTL